MNGSMVQCCLLEDVRLSGRASAVSVSCLSGAYKCGFV